ncbi:MAG: amidohydrolase family protein [Acidobacteriota bacterium]
MLRSARPKPTPKSILSELLTVALAFGTAILALPALSGEPVTADRSVFLKGGFLVDPDLGSVERRNLLIVDGKIEGTPTRQPKNFAGRVIDVSGQYVIPGLRDLHVHSMVQGRITGPPFMLGSDVAARRMTQVGVVGMLDLLHLENYIFPMRDRQRSGDLDGADIFAAGAVLTAPGGHGTEYGLPARLVESPDDARRHVSELAELKADVVKLIYEHPTEGVETWREELPTIELDELKAAVDAAKKHGLKTVVHIRSWRDIRDSAEVGADAVTHLPSEPMPADLPALLARRGTVVIPTLARGDMDFVRAGALDGPLLQRVTGPEVLADYRDWDRSSERSLSFTAAMARAQRHRADAMAALHRAGVRFAAGTDSGNSWTVHGVSLHRELELMVDAGLGPRDALRAATTEAGRFLGQSWGLESGHDGSVVVLAESPLDDIRNTREISWVIHRGEPVDLQAWHAPAPPPTSM